MDIGSRIKELRRERHLSQEGLAQRLGISRQAVAKWENHTAFPSTSNLLALCEALDVSLEELIPLESGGNPPSKSIWEQMRIPLLVASIIFLLLVIFLCSVYFQQRLPSNTIGYADGETGIWVSGPPVLLYLLGGVTLLLVAITIFSFVRVQNQRKGPKS